jgi:hypothetical protein
MNKYRFITTVWGDKFTDLYLNITLASLMTSGNFVYLTNKKAVYNIITKNSDCEKIRNSQIFKLVSNYVEFEFIILPDLEFINAVSSDSHWYFWSYALKRAELEGDYVIFIMPDAVYGENTIERWINALESGYKAVYALGAQIVQEISYSKIHEGFRNSETGIIQISNESLKSLVLDYLHPVFIANIDKSTIINNHPEFFIQLKESVGLSVNVLAQHPFCIKLNEFRIGPGLNPLDKNELIFVDELCFAGLEPIDKYANNYRFSYIDKMEKKISIGHWRSIFATTANNIDYNHKHLLIRNDKILSELDVQGNNFRSYYYFQNSLKSEVFYNIIRYCDVNFSVEMANLLRFYLYDRLIFKFFQLNKEYIFFIDETLFEPYFLNEFVFNKNWRRQVYCKLISCINIKDENYEINPEVNFVKINNVNIGFKHKKNKNIHFPKMSIPPHDIFRKIIFKFPKNNRIFFEKLGHLHKLYKHYGLNYALFYFINRIRFKIKKNKDSNFIIDDKEKIKKFSRLRNIIDLRNSYIKKLYADHKEKCSSLTQDFIYVDVQYNNLIEKFIKNINKYNHGLFLYEIAQKYYIDGYVDLAIKFYKKVILKSSIFYSFDENPNVKARALRRLAFIYESNGQFAKSIDYYEKYLEINPSDSDIRKLYIDLMIKNKRNLHLSVFFGLEINYLEYY